MDVSADILALIHDDLVDARARSLPDLLDALAANMVKATGARAGLLLAVDSEGELLAVGADAQLTIDRGKLFDEARPLLQDHEPGRLAWLDCGGATSADTHTRCAFAATSLEHRGLPVALAVLAICRRDEVAAVEERLRGLSALLPVAILTARRSEAWRRLESLQEALRELFARSRPSEADWHLDSFVERLRTLYRADVATVLLVDDDELRLAATSDSALAAGEPVVYPRGEGLTGWVFAHDQPLRLANAGDIEEVRRATGIERTKPRHAEYDPLGAPTEVYLGVPMRFAGEVVGVVRLSRRLGGGRFSQEDVRSLQVGADLLGAGLARAREMLLARAVLDSTSEGIAVSSRHPVGNEHAEARLVLANRGMAQLLGYSATALDGLAKSGMRARDFYVPQDYDALRGELRKVVESPERRGELGPLTCRLRRSDGAAVAVNISYRIVANPLVKPETFYTIGIARRAGENDEMASRHQRMLELLDAMGMAYFRADSAGHTIESTPMDEQLTGYSRTELARMPRRRLYADPAQRDQLLAEANLEGGLRTGRSVQFRRKNGELFWAAGDIRMRTGSDRELLGIEGFYRDVTPRMGLQQFLNVDDRELLTEAELYTRLREQAVHLNYVASIGHQLQTPLGALVGTLNNFVNRVYSGEELTERMPWVIGQVRVCARLVRNHTFMDQILRGESFATQPVSLTKLAIETKLDFIHLIKDRKLTFDVDDRSLNRLGTVDAHPDLMRQVVVNLVDNAIKYAAPGSTITVRGHRWQRGGVFEISSCGLPLSDEDRRHVFERGFRARNAQALVPHGTGIGLWLVKRIVDLHKAIIHCNVVPEDGRQRVLFHIEFPPQQPPPSSGRGSHESRQSAGYRPRHRRPTQ